MKISKLTKKYKATIPQEIRKYLGLEPGDMVSFEIDSDRVIIKRITTFDHEWQKSLEMTLNEWASLEDDEAYDSL